VPESIWESLFVSNIASASQDMQRQSPPTFNARHAALSSAVSGFCENQVDMIFPLLDTFTTQGSSVGGSILVTRLIA
jgi:hypothetical protein